MDRELLLDYLLDKMSKVGRDQFRQDRRVQGQITLGELIIALKQHDPDTPVILETGFALSLGNPHSYHGCYDELAFTLVEEIVLLGAFLRKAESCLNAEFSGHKGGEYTMNHDTFLWCSEHGKSHNSMMIVGVKKVNGIVQVQTKPFNYKV